MVLIAFGLREGKVLVVLGSYNGFSGNVREQRHKELKALIKSGQVKDPMTMSCVKCGQDKGIRHYHTEDYSTATSGIECFCWTCHMVTHSKRRAPAACDAYWKRISEGYVPAPVYRNDFSILRENYGIN